MSREKHAPRPVGFWAAVAVFILLLALVVTMTALLGSTPHIPLLIAAAAAAIIGFMHHYSWGEMLDGITDAIKTAVPALLIIMTIGLLISAWMAGGIIPAMVYYGLQIISPRFFLVTALLLCSIVSLAIGSSLSTIGTVGVALFGIGSALGVPPAITAGAIVSGAYFGDKMSPPAAPTAAGTGDGDLSDPGAARPDRRRRFGAAVRRVCAGHTCTGITYRGDGWLFRLHRYGCRGHTGQPRRDLEYDENGGARAHCAELFRDF